MPVIHIDYSHAADEDSVRALTDAIHTIVSEATGIENVPVYARRAPIQAKTAPFEIFIEMSEEEIKELMSLVADIKRHIEKWKSENSFAYPINFSLIPTRWKTESGI